MAAIERLDGDACTGDLSNKNEAFTRAYTRKYNRYMRTLYDTTDEVRLPEKEKLAEEREKIIRQLEAEWQASNRSWAPAGADEAAAMDDGGELLAFAGQVRERRRGGRTRGAGTEGGLGYRDVKGTIAVPPGVPQPPLQDARWHPQRTAHGRPR